MDTRGCSTAQNNKRLERATKRYSALPRDPSQSITHRSEVISVYNYAPVAAYDADDALQRFGKLKIEATSFTISEPTESLEVSALIYALADEDQRRILESEYDVAPFQVETITLERIFIDKLFAAEAYVRKSDIGLRAFEAAKHIYDLAVMCEQDRFDFAAASLALTHISEELSANEAWQKCELPSVNPVCRAVPAHSESETGQEKRRMLKSQEHGSER